MRLKPFSVWSLVAALVFLIVGCSSAGKHASTTIAATSSTAVTTTTVSPSRVVAKLGPCPRSAVVASDLGTTGFNAGVKGLATSLVPIKPLNVRICAYRIAAPLRDVVLDAPEALRFTADTNRNRTPPNMRSCPGGLTFFVTFANDVQHVSLLDFCDYHLTNGAFAADATSLWLNELQSYTTGTVVGTLREVGGPAPGLNRQIAGTVIAISPFGQSWRATTTATQPFTLAVPAGTYRLFGSSPLINDGQSQCSAAAPVVVVVGKTTQVHVVCSIK